jgi:hypothetical protein
MVDVLGLEEGKAADDAAAVVVAARTDAIATAERLRAATVIHFLHAAGVAASAHTGWAPKPLAECKVCGEAVTDRWQVKPIDLEDTARTDTAPRNGPTTRHTWRARRPPSAA